MSEVRIKNGRGNGGYTAAVDSQGRLTTTASTETELQDAAENSAMWNLETGYLALSNDSASGVLYLKNTGTEDLLVSLYVILAKASTGGSGDLLVEILKDPSAGTVVSDASVANPVNMNFGSTANPSALYYKGGQGKTITGHTNALVSKTTADNRLLLGTFTVLPQGASLGIRLTPPPGNTSMDVNTIIELYEETS